MTEQGLSATKRLLAGDAWRKSRLHDMRGNLVDLRGLATDGPRALVGAVERELFKHYPPLPWIPYPAIRALSRVHRPSWHVLEHGAGMSTIWWARHVATVHSIEANPTWYARIKQTLAQQNLRNVTLELRDDATYSDLDAFGDGAFDMVVIDGHARDQVARQAVRILRRPGYIYLDNTDYAAEWSEMYGEAEEILRAEASRWNASVRYFTGFAPATLVASQGLLLAFPPDTSPANAA